MVQLLSFTMLSAAVLILAFKVKSLENKLESAQQIIGHMLLGNITGARIDEDGEVVIEYKEVE